MHRHVEGRFFLLVLCVKLNLGMVQKKLDALKVAVPCCEVQRRVTLPISKVKIGHRVGIVFVLQTCQCASQFVTLIIIARSSPVDTVMNCATPSLKQKRSVSDDLTQIDARASTCSQHTFTSIRNGSICS
eukprot:m.362465 g.362465  ORF g.362465 m.362465 type:complete len:130 (-) comp16649_c1_seq32:5280-5669(-)